MTDNAEGNELLNINIGMETETAEQQLEAFFSRVDEMQQQYYESVMQGNEASGEFFNKLTEIKEAAFSQSGAFEELNQQLNDVAASYERINQVQAGGDGGVAPGSSYLGYGTEGGLIGPAESDSGGGSAYALGRGARAIGQLTGNQDAGNAVADLLYIRQAVEQLDGVLGGFNATVTAAPGLLTPLVESFTALGIPMAGLAAVALPVAGALYEVVQAVNAFNTIIKDGQDAVNKAETELQKFFQIIETGTTDQLQKQIADQQVIVDSNNKSVETNEPLLRNELEKRLKPFHISDEDITQIFNQIIAGDLDPKKALAAVKAPAGMTPAEFQGYLNDPAITSLVDNIKKFQSASGDASSQIEKLTAGMKDSTVIANDAAEAARKQADDDIARNRQFLADDQLTSQAAKDKVAALKDDAAQQQRAIDTIKATSAALDPLSQEYLANKKAIEDHNAALQADYAEIYHITNESVYLIAAREAEADAIKQTKKALEDLAKAQETGDKQAADLQTQTANQRETAALKEAQAEEQYTQGSIQDAFERSKIALAESRKEVDAKQAAADKIDDVMAKMDDDINKAYRDLAAKQTEDTIKAAEDLGKITREENYKEREDRIDHLNKLSDIAKKEKDNESDALYDRNFRELSKIQSHKDDAVKAEDDAYSAREAAEQRHTQDLINERNIRLNEEMAAQQRANALKIQEIQIAEREQETQITITEQRKITALRTGEQQQIQDLTTMEGYKLQLLRQGMQNELNLLQLQENQRMAIIRNTLYEAQLKATQSLPSIRPAGLYDSDGIREFDSGGSFNAGEKFIMSEGQNAERLDIGGHSYNVGGAALVYPLQGGSVANPGRDGGSRTPVTINVGPIYDARDPEKTAALIKDRVAVELGSYFGDH